MSYISFIDNPASIFVEGTAGCRRTLAIDISEVIVRGTVVCGRIRAEGRVVLYRSDRDMLRGAMPLFDDFIVSHDDTDADVRERIVSVLDDGREQTWHEVARKARVVSSLGDRPPSCLVNCDPRIGINLVTHGLWLRVPLLRTCDELVEALDSMQSFAPGIDGSRVVIEDDEGNRSYYEVDGRYFRNCMPDYEPADDDVRALWHHIEILKEDFEMQPPRFAARALDTQRYPPGWWKSLGF